MITIQPQTMMCMNDDCIESATTISSYAAAAQTTDDDESSKVMRSTLNDYDVLCGRHKAAFNNTGNRRFRVTVGLSLERFMNTKSRKEKNTVIKSILKIVQGNGGRFLEYKKNVGLIELNAKKAHMKVGHALRDMALASRNAVVTESTATKTTTTSTTIEANALTSVASSTGVASTLANSNNDNDQSPLDPLDLLEVIPVDEFITLHEPQQQPTDQVPVLDQDIDMLQWLVGESNELLQVEPEPAIEPLPFNPQTRDCSSRASIVLDKGLLQWLVGENNDPAERFEMV